MDSNGLSDPYLKIYLMPDPNKKTKHDKKTKQKTKIIKKTLNPKWDTSFDFSMSPLDLATHTVSQIKLSSSKLPLSILLDLSWS